MISDEAMGERMAAQIVKLSLTQDRMVVDLAIFRAMTRAAVRNYYGIGEKT